MFSFFKKEKRIKIENPKSNIEDLIAPGALKIEPSDLRIGKKYVRTLFVFTLPRYLTSQWLSPVIMWDREMDISIFIHPADTKIVLKNLRKKVARIQAQINEEEKRGKVRDPMLEIALNDIEELRNILQEKSEKLFQMGLYINIYGNSAEELDKIENEVRALLETKMIYLKVASFRQKEGFNSVLPVAENKLMILNSLNTTPLSSIFPFVSTSLSDNKGILYGVNLHNNSLIIFNRFSLENANTVLFGKSGGGKSYCVKLEALRSLMFGTEIIIIDPEKEYKYLAEAVDGTFIDISLTSPHHINPFDLPKPREDESIGEILRSNIATLVGLLKIMLGKLTPKEESIIDKAITETYASRDITPNSEINEITPPVMGDLLTILKGMEGAEDLALRLERFVSGSYAGFFNQPTNVALNRKLIVFSIRDMEDELRPMAMYVILHYIWNIVRSELKKRILIVDEAWWMMQHPEGAAFLFSIAKRARKYYLGLTTITQDVEDFLNSQYGPPILNNSSLQMLFRQSPTSINILGKTFKLTEEEKIILQGVKVGEGLFFAGFKHAFMRVIASYTEDQIITTNPAQLLEIEKAKKELEGIEK